MVKNRFIAGMSAAALASTMLGYLPAMAVYVSAAEPKSMHTSVYSDLNTERTWSIDTYDYMTPEENAKVSSVTLEFTGAYDEGEIDVTLNALTFYDEYSEWREKGDEYYRDDGVYTAHLNDLNGIAQADEDEDNFSVSLDWASRYISRQPVFATYESLYFYDSEGGLIKKIDGNDTGYTSDRGTTFSPVNATSVSQLESAHNSTDSFRTNYRYTIPGAQALAVTFSDNTDLSFDNPDDEDSDSDYIYIYPNAASGNYNEYRSYGSKELSGATVYVFGDTLDMLYASNGHSNFGFKVTDVKAVDPSLVSGGNIDVTGVDDFKSLHNLPAGYNKTYHYTHSNSSAAGLKLTFSEQTAMNEDYDSYISISAGDYSYTYRGNSLAGQTVVIPGNYANVYVTTDSGDSRSYGFDVVKIEEATEDEILVGRKYVTDIADFKTPHPLAKGYNKTIVYENSQYDCTKITFSDQTGMADDDDSFITINANGMSRSYYASELAGKSFTYNGSSIEVSCYAASDNCYGFDVVKAEQGDPNDVEGPKTIKNDFLKVYVSGDSYSIGTTGGDPDNANDDDRTMLYGFPDNGTSNTYFSIDSDKIRFNADSIKEDKEAEVPTIVATSNKGKIDIEQKHELVNNVATGQSDVVKISYTVTNNDTVAHNVGCRMMMDTMVGDNDEAPFRVPGTGDVTTGTSYKGSNIPQSWQAFDNLLEPSVIAQGAFLRDPTNPPDEVRFTNWSDATSWNDSITNQGSENGDSAVEIYWLEKSLPAGESVTYVTYYGLSELVSDMTPPLALALSGDSFASQIDYDDEKGQPVYNSLVYTAYLTNIDTVDVVNATAELKLPEGFEFTDRNGNTAVRSYPIVKPGEIVQVDWEIKIDPTKVTELSRYPIALYTNADNDVEKTVSKNVTIPKTLTEKVSIDNTDVSGTLDYVYTGSEIVPTFKLMNGETELVENGNYTVEYTNNTNVGTATATFTGIGMYNGTKTVEFNITPMQLSDLTAALEQTSYVYNGTEFKPAASLSFRGAEAKLDASLFDVAYANNINAGTATATITSKSPNFTGSVVKEFTIEKAAMTDSMVTLDSAAQVYDGTAKTPAVTVKNGSTTLVSGTDYTVSYASNVSAGTAAVTVTAKGNYTGTVTKSFTISPANVSTADVTLSPASYTYDGTEKKPAVTVKMGTKTLAAADYTVSYSNNVKAGTATVTVTGKGNYTGTASKSFTINKKAISSATVSVSGKQYVYTGKALKPAATVKLGTKTLVSGTDYTITYLNNKNTGKATAKVTGKGNYSGTKTVYFYIKPKAAKISKVTTPKTKQVKVAWKKDTQATGYEVVIATNKACTKGKKTATIKKNSTVSKTFTGLKKGTTYYAKVRAYKTIGSKKYYGAYSAVKSVKCK